MTPLRQKMMRELQLHCKSPRTVEAYVTAVAQLARHYGRSVPSAPFGRHSALGHFLTRSSAMIETDVSSSAFVGRPFGGDALYMARRSFLGFPSSGALLA